MTKKTTTKNSETEFKCLLDRTSWQKLMDHAQGLEDVVQQQQLNIFFDDQCKTLGTSRWALRLRREASRDLLTCKGPSREAEGLVKRIEIECLLEEPKADAFLIRPSLSTFNYSPCTALLEQFGDLAIQAHFIFMNERTCIPWQGLQLELDHSLSNGQHLYELECECDEKQASSVKARLVQWLDAFQIPWQNSTQNKLAWALNQYGESSNKPLNLSNLMRPKPKPSS